jgi:hypothetical protein
MTKAADTANILKQPFTNTLGGSNYRAGVNAGDSVASGGEFNVLVGDEAGTAITTGTDNTFIGALAGDALIDSDHNVAVGYQSQTADTKGSKSTALGAFSLNAQNFTSATDSHNTAIGYSAGGAVTTGTSNTLIGSQSGNATNTGVRNVAIGHEAMYSQTDGSNNVSIGWQAGYTNNGNNNVAIGWQALYSGNGSDSCVAIGREALEVATGDSNTAIGYQAGQGLTTGVNNIEIGYQSGTYSTALQTGGQNILIGNYSKTSSSSIDYEIVIGYNAAGQGNQTFTFGQGSVDTSIGFGGTGWNAPSDERLKEDIKDETVGLAFINELRPVTFQWKKEKDIPEDMEGYDKDSDERVMNGKYNHGFIAQEVKAVIDKYDIKDGLGLWLEAGKDKRQRLAESELIPFLTKAIQELSAQVTALETENKTQSTQIADLISRVTALESA